MGGERVMDLKRNEKEKRRFKSQPLKLQGRIKLQASKDQKECSTLILEI
jgi:hypothetical protein